MRQQSDRQLRDRQLSDLHSHAMRQEAFRHSAVRSAANAAARQQLSDALDSWMEMKFPKPPPEPTIVFVQEDDGSADLGSRNFDVGKWMKKSRSWW